MRTVLLVHNIYDIFQLIKNSTSDVHIRYVFNRPKCLRLYDVMIFMYSSLYCCVILYYADVFGDVFVIFKMKSAIKCFMNALNPCASNLSKDCLIQSWIYIRNVPQLSLIIYIVQLRYFMGRYR